MDRPQKVWVATSLPGPGGGRASSQALGLQGVSVPSRRRSVYLGLPCLSLGPECRDTACRWRGRPLQASRTLQWPLSHSDSYRRICNCPGEADVQTGRPF